MASGQQDIADRLNLLQTYYDLYYDAQTEFTSYVLPDNFGKLIRTEPELTLRDVNELKTYSQDSSMPTGGLHSIAVWHNGENFQCAVMDLPSASGTVRLWYIINTLFYSPSGGNSQEWGAFDGSAFSGNLKLPEKYTDLLILYMMGKCFPDAKQEYLFEIERQKGNPSSTFSSELTYNLGDCKDE